MNEEYFYVERGDVDDGSLMLRGEEHKHAARVLRKKVGDRIFVTNGDDTMFEAEIISLERMFIRCAIRRTTRRRNEPKTHVTLAVSLLRTPARYDFLVEKSTELGVRSIVPLICERTIAHHEKHDRLRRVALAAMKQSGRCYLPNIAPSTTFEALVMNAGQYSLRLIPHESTEQSHFIGTVLRAHGNVHSVLIAIGPEGGFTGPEIELASRQNFVPTSLGPRRLRSETAALSSLGFVVGGW